VATLTVLAALGPAPVVPAAASQVAQPTVVSDNPANWTPWVDDGRVLAIAQVGTEIVVGGSFTTVQ